MLSSCKKWKLHVAFIWKVLLPLQFCERVAIIALQATDEQNYAVFFQQAKAPILKGPK